MVRKTVSSGTAAKPASKSTTARKTVRKTAAKSTNGSGAVARKSTEITPRRAAMSKTAQSLKSPKVLLPLAVAVGVGIAAVRKALTSGKDAKTLPRLAKEVSKEVSPRVTEALHALAELGRELRAKIR